MHTITTVRIRHRSLGLLRINLCQPFVNLGPCSSASLELEIPKLTVGLDAELMQACSTESRVRFRDCVALWERRTVRRWTSISLMFVRSNAESNL